MMTAQTNTRVFSPAFGRGVAVLGGIILSSCLFAVNEALAAPVPVDHAGSTTLENDPPVAHLNALAARGATVDTVFFGGVDANGVAVEGGVWDFEDGTLQGWTSRDFTDSGLYFRRVEVPFIGAISMNADGSASIGSIWVGATQPEADALCWPGGLGYSNNWRQRATKTLTYDGTGVVELEFDYFVDSETQFDFSYVYVTVDGSKSPPLNTSVWGDIETGFGYSGGGQAGTGIGTPTDPAHDAITIDPLFLPFGGGPYDLSFEFDSDPLYADGGGTGGGFFDSEFGPFGVDVVTVDGVSVGDFETGDDGWAFSYGSPVGSFMTVEHLDDLDPIDGDCACPLTVPGNDYVLLAADPVLGHDEDQHEELSSPPADVGDHPSTTVGMLWAAWADLPFIGGTGYRRGIHYYPWTCPETGIVGWTQTHAGPGGFTFTSTPTCERLVEDLSSYYSSDVDSVKVVFEIIAGCDNFGECEFDTYNDATPYFDDVRFYLLDTGTDAPRITLDLTFGDRFAIMNTLSPHAHVDAKSWYDHNRGDGDLSNANMGDSAVVFAGTEAGTRVFMNFRVYPGPETNTGNPFFTRYGGSLAPNWAKARMDTAETVSGPSAGSFATYVHEDAGGIEGTSGYKIIEDGVLTPGVTVEYFFTADFGPGQPERVEPDTTGDFFLEWEALPGYFDGGNGTILGPCVLYVDAFNDGGQLPIELYGLTPNLGQDLNGGDLWDRYDYIAASGNTPAPLARESGGDADNGMTKFQSLAYSTILYNTGTNATEGLRDGDADLLIDWLTNTDFGRPEVDKGLWLSGNGMADILDRPGRPNANSLLTAYAGAVLTDVTYRDEAVGGPDSSFCVRLDPTVGRNFGFGLPYSTVTRNGCPDLESFNVISPVGPGVGDQVYVNQDDGGDVTPHASVSNDRWDPGSGRYGVVIDAYSLHFLRSVPADFSTDDCAAVEDSSAIGDRMSDVFAWMRVPTGGLAVCEYRGGLPDTPPDDAPPARTVLFQNTPNPFNPRTTVRYDLARDADVTLQVYDVSGRLVRTLVSDPQIAGSYTVEWDGTTDEGVVVSSGVFWARMATSRGFRATTKMVVLK